MDSKTQKIKTNYEELSFQKERYLLFKYKKLNIEKLRNDYFRIEPQLKEVENLFLKAETPVNFLNYLEEAGDLSGLQHIADERKRLVAVSFDSDFCNI